MGPSLPQSDGDARERSDGLAIKRELYRYDYAYPPGIAVASSLPPGEEFSACFAAHIVAIQMKTFENGMASEGQREDSQSNRRLNFLSTAARALLSPADLGAVMGAQLDAGSRMMRDDRPAPDLALPTTGVPRDWERALSSLFIRAPGYGTRCTTTLLFGRDGSVQFEERSWNGLGRETGSVQQRIEPAR